jgi:glycosyltransferase involved in cell wall biosynthesis
LKKVLLLTYYWPPSGGSSVQRWLKMLKYFPEMGIEPFVITVDPALASYPLKDESLEQDIHPGISIFKTPTREFYNAYKKLTGKKEIPYAGFINEQKADWKQIVSRIIRSHFFIPDPRRGWNRFVYKKAVELIKHNDIKTVITATPPHSTQLVGLMLKKKFNLNWIADLQDPWTDIYYYRQLFHSPISAAIDARYERRVLENADYIITVSDSIRDIFQLKSRKINPDKIIVVPNGYDEDDFREKAQTGTEPFTISYVGTLNEDYYPLDSFLQAVEGIAATNRKILLRFVGKVSPPAMQKIRSTKGIPAEFIDYVPHEESVKYLQKTNALLLIIPRMDQNEGILTGKLFEYLGSGKKIIGIGPSQGDAAKIIRDCGSGNMFDYEKSEEIKKYLDGIIEDANKKPFQPNWQQITQYSRRSQANMIAQLL